MQDTLLKESPSSASHCLTLGKSFIPVPLLHAIASFPVPSFENWRSALLTVKFTNVRVSLLFWSKENHMCLLSPQLPSTRLFPFWCQTCGFLTSSNSAMPLGVLQFDSLLTLSTWRERQIPQIKGSVIQGGSPPPANGNLQVPGSTF